jgi:hypothetical protein
MQTDTKFRPMLLELQLTLSHEQIISIAAELRKQPELLTPGDVKRWITDTVRTLTR